MLTATETTVSCRVCGIDNWFNCDCYYFHGGEGSLGDMKVEVYHCPECGWVAECYPNCPVKEAGK